MVNALILKSNVVPRVQSVSLYDERQDKRQRTVAMRKQFHQVEQDSLVHWKFCINKKEELKRMNDGTAGGIMVNQSSHPETPLLIPIQIAIENPSCHENMLSSLKCSQSLVRSWPAGSHRLRSCQRLDLGCRTGQQYRHRRDFVRSLECSGWLLAGR